MKELRLEELYALFPGDELPRYEIIPGDEMPQPYRGLLVHEHHMTVTVEAYHGGPVDVRILERRQDGSDYARKILLTRQTDGAVVQFGIMRLDFSSVSPEVRQAVESQQTPLGRILIEHNVHREVHLTKLWKVTPGEDLRRWFNMSPGQITFGRTAIIHCNGEPAVELLEIVTPV